MKEGSSKLSRRDFLEWAFYAGVTTVATGMGIKFAPEKPAEVANYPMPRWLNPEGTKVPTFINTDDAHESYVRGCIENSPVIQRVLARTYEERFYGSTQEPPKLGEEYERHVEYAQEALTEFGFKPSLDDTLRAANFTLSASAIFLPSDVKQISKVDFSLFGNETDIKQVEMVKKAFPRVFPVSPTSPQDDKTMLWSYMGPDRFIHATQHQLIASETMYLMRDGVTYDQMMPAGIGILVASSSENPGVALSKVISQGWEALESVRNPPLLVALGANSGIQTGYYDRFVSLDIQANLLGAYAGVSSVQAGMGYRSCDTIIDVLNHPVVTRPLKDEWHPQVSMDFALPIAV